MSIGGVKEKKERALGERLNLKAERCNTPKCAAVRKPFRPGVHGHKRRRKNVSEFGLQIQEKQKFKLSYGISDRELRRVFEHASKNPESTAAMIIILLERRLDNVLFRMGFAGSRAFARQLVVHGHILVNDQRVRSPGFLVKIGDYISFRVESKESAVFKKLTESLKKFDPPAWLRLENDKVEGEVIALPQDSLVPFNVNLLVESFSK